MHLTHNYSVSIFFTHLYLGYKTYISTEVAVTRLRAGRSGVRIPAQTTDLSHLHMVQTNSGVHSASYSIRNGVVSRGQSSQGVKLTTHFRLVPRLRMRGAIPVLPLYALTLWTAKTWPFEILSLFVKYSVTNGRAEYSHSRVAFQKCYNFVTNPIT